MFVKICGITNESDALMAVAMGADALGFVFAPSSRQVAVPQVRDIVRRVHPEVLTVGVFRDEAPQRVVDLVNSTGLRAVQLHGHESPDEAAYIRRRVGFVIKAFSAGDAMASHAADYPVDAVLLDAERPGSGETFDWSVARAIPRDVRLVVAGGLDPDNVARAVEAIQPWGVDVSSGVEHSPGHKDVRRTRWFVLEAKGGVIGDVVRLDSLPDEDLTDGHPEEGPIDEGPIDDASIESTPFDEDRFEEDRIDDGAGTAVLDDGSAGAANWPEDGLPLAGTPAASGVEDGGPIDDDGEPTDRWTAG